MRNLDAEAEFIAEDDATAARVVVELVLSAAAMLASQPGPGRPGRVANRRELVVLKTRDIVPYRVRGETVAELRVVHTSRRLPPAAEAVSRVDQLARRAREAVWQCRLARSFAAGLLTDASTVRPHGPVSRSFRVCS